MNPKYEPMYAEIVSVFQAFNTQTRLDMSPREAADVLMEPLEQEVAFKDVDHFLGLQLTILDALAQQRIGYEGIDIPKLHKSLAPIISKSKIFGDD